MNEPLAHHIIKLLTLSHLVLSSVLGEGFVELQVIDYVGLVKLD